MRNSSRCCSPCSWPPCFCRHRLQMDKPVLRGGGAGSEKLVCHIDSSTAIGEPVASPDSRHVAYVAKAGAKRLVVVDGKEAKPYDFIELSTIVFSPDSHGWPMWRLSAESSLWWWTAKRINPTMRSISALQSGQPAAGVYGKSGSAVACRGGWQRGEAQRHD